MILYDDVMYLIHDTCHVLHALTTVSHNITGVSIKIEVASRFEKSIRLYQQGAVSPLFLEGSGGVLPHKYLEISKP